MEIYDTVAASTLEKGDQIKIGFDYLELTYEPVDETDAILIKGYSYESGDDVTYLLSPDDQIDLWKV